MSERSRMIPLVDTHCHLLPAMDDGPGSWDVSIEMCRMAWADGVRGIAATVHQNEHWPNATPAAIRDQSAQLVQRLDELEIPLTIYPTAEVMVAPDTEEAFEAGRLLTVADRREYLLIEFPRGAYLDISQLVSN